MVSEKTELVGAIHVHQTDFPPGSPPCRGSRFSLLAPTDDPWIWYVEWPERQTVLDCHYAGYSVDLVAWDYYDGTDGLTITPRTF